MIFPPAVSGAAVAYEIEKSLRFRASASAYLERTPSTGSGGNVWTWSGWLKRGAFTGSTEQLIFNAGFYVNSANRNVAGISIFQEQLRVFHIVNSTMQSEMYTTALLRDPSAHYHIFVRRTGATYQIYINNVLQTLTGVVGPAATNDLFGASGRVHRIGLSIPGISPFPLDGYLSETNFIDGQALDPTSFGEFDTNGVWVPKAYTGTYGTNGFYLPFSNGTSLSTLTADASGNGNNWTANNISLTAGVNYDWMDDTPTNNHATLNNLVSGAANISKANLASGTTPVRATFDALAISSYWEVTAGASAVTAGVINEAGTTHTTTVTANKTFGFRLSTAGALDYINITDGGSWTSIATGLTGSRFPYGTTAAADWNFGQRPFTGSVPGGYAKLCASNLTNTTITTSGTFTGNASTDGPDVFLNGVPTAMTINGNSVTFGTHADKTAKGFKVRSSSASYNAAGTNTYSITSTGAAFKNARAQVNP